MRFALLLIAAAAAGLCADTDFNGRWDLKASNESRNRAWWLEVQGAGSPKLAGRFVGFPGGDTNRIEDIRLQNGELIFTFTREPNGRQKQRIHQEYRARLNGKDKLTGRMQDGGRRSSSPDGARLKSRTKTTARGGKASPSSSSTAKISPAGCRW